MEVGIVTVDRLDLVIDKSRIHRSREVLGSNPPAEIAQALFIQGLEYDGRKDITLVQNPITKGIRNEKEEHFCVLRLPEDKYLSHFTPRNGGSEAIADDLLDVVRGNSMVPCTKILNSDSTNVNTGWENGVNARMEVFLGRRLVWFVCMLHTNELPL